MNSLGNPINILAIIITTYWVVMNFFLIKTEFFAAGKNSSLPPEVVIRKILNSQETSHLQIRSKGEPIGMCKWSTTIKQAQATNATTAIQEGMVLNPIGYIASLEGSFDIKPLQTKLRFDFAIEIKPDLRWDLLHLYFKSQHGECVIEASATDQIIKTVLLVPGFTGQTNLLTFTEAQNPQNLVRALLPNTLSNLDGLFSLVALSTSVDFLSKNTSGDPVSLRATLDNVKVQKSTIKAYKLEIDLGGQNLARAFVSTVGEVLKIDLPFQLQLVNPLTVGTDQ